MTVQFIEAALEAVLFASGEPIPVDRVAQSLGVDKPTLQKIVKNLSDGKYGAKSGIKILELDGSLQMTTRGEYADYVRAILDVKRDAPLSQAAMEVLSIIAYNQPVTKGYIEQVRGVDCSGVVNSLVVKNLVEERGRLDIPGKPIIYGTTLEFLKCFGMRSLDDLPPLEEGTAADTDE